MTAIKEKTIELIKALPDGAMSHVFDMIRERTEKEKKAAEEYADFPYPLGPLDPFLISPSGDPYWSYPGNVTALQEDMQRAKEWELKGKTTEGLVKEGKLIYKTMEELEAMANEQDLFH